MELARVSSSWETTQTHLCTFLDFVRFFTYLKVKAPSSSNAVAHTKCVLPETHLFFPRHSGVTTRSALFLAWVATPGTRNTERALVNLRDVTQYIAYRRFQSIYCLYNLCWNPEIHCEIQKSTVKSRNPFWNPEIHSKIRKSNSGFY